MYDKEKDAQKIEKDVQEEKEPNVVFLQPPSIPLLGPGTICCKVYTPHGYKEQVTLTLTERDCSVINLLRKHSATLKFPPILRIAGGWVRDKLIKRDSHDIDVAVEGMRVLEYAVLFSESAQGGNVHTIKLNPEKSKHIETVVFNAMGISLDFVALRKDVYDGNTRFPKVERATIEEDAIRRDATVNSLYFNVLTLEVEDYVGHGVEDLNNRVLDTPLEPYSTFSDDPLRILRFIRFSALLGFEISERVKHALAKRELVNRITTHVSRERIGIEVRKLLVEGRLEFLDWIREFDMEEVVYLDPTQLAPQTQQQLFRDLVSLSWTETEECKEVYGFCFKDTQERVFLIALLSALYHVVVKKGGNTASALVKSAFVYGNDEWRFILMTEKCIEEIRDASKNGINRAFVATLARNYGDLLPIVVELCCLNEETVEVARLVQGVAAGLDLKSVRRERPLFSGNEILEYFDVKGKTIACCMNRALWFQMEKENRGREEVLELLSREYPRKRSQ